MTSIRLPPLIASSVDSQETTSQSLVELSAAPEANKGSCKVNAVTPASCPANLGQLVEVSRLVVSGFLGVPEKKRWGFFCSIFVSSSKLAIDYKS